MVNEGGDLDDAIHRLGAVPSCPHDWRPEERTDSDPLHANLRPAVAGFATHQALDQLRARLPANAILVSDVELTSIRSRPSGAPMSPGSLLVTNGWSSMGFPGIPATYAAKLVHPDWPVVGVIGDGCLQMTAGELAVEEHRLGLAAPIVGAERRLANAPAHQAGPQGIPGVRRRPGYVRTDAPPHYFGVPCRSLPLTQEFAAALDWASALDGPSVIEAVVQLGWLLLDGLRLTANCVRAGTDAAETCACSPATKGSPG